MLIASLALVMTAIVHALAAHDSVGGDSVGGDMVNGDRVRGDSIRDASPSPVPVPAPVTMLTSSAMPSTPATLQLLLVALSRLSAFGGFSALYLLTAETYPCVPSPQNPPHLRTPATSTYLIPNGSRSLLRRTRMRATAFGLVSAASRLAGTVSPFVAGTLWDASPVGALVCYALSAAACAAALLARVAETSRRPMPDELTSLVPEPESGRQGAHSSEHGERVS